MKKNFAVLIGLLFMTFTANATETSYLKIKLDNQKEISYPPGIGFVAQDADGNTVLSPSELETMKVYEVKMPITLFVFTSWNDAPDVYEISSGTLSLGHTDMDYNPDTQYTYGRAKKGETYGRTKEGETYGRAKEGETYGRAKEGETYGRAKEGETYGRAKEGETYGRAKEGETYGRAKEGEDYGRWTMTSNGVSMTRARYFANDAKTAYNASIEFSNNVVFYYRDGAVSAWQNGKDLEITGNYLIKTTEGIIKLSYNPANKELWWVFDNN